MFVSLFITHLRTPSRHTGSPNTLVVFTCRASSTCRKMVPKQQVVLVPTLQPLQWEMRGWEKKWKIRLCISNLKSV